MARRARRIAGLPRGFRHEAVSDRLLERLLATRPELTESVDADLVRHLVVSHHGQARPLLPPVVDEAAPPVRLAIDGINLAMAPSPTLEDWGHPDRFERLGMRYGWWGLALLETIVRLADMLCSARSEEDR